MYKKLNVEKGKLFIIGDLHGEVTELFEALVLEGFNFSEDTLLSTGDLIDRGENSLAALRLLEEPWFHCVRGNHEDMAYSGDFYNWYNNGGLWYRQLNTTDRLEADRLIKKIGDLPYILEVTFGTKKIVVSHASYPSDSYEYDKPVDANEVIWGRSVMKGIKNGDDLGVMQGADAFFFGHTPVKEILKHYNRYFIDTGAGKGGKLTIASITL